MFDLSSQIVDAIIESMDAQGELSKRALESAEIRAGILRLLFSWEMAEPMQFSPAEPVDYLGFSWTHMNPSPFARYQ